MPRFYFHLHECGEVADDPEGSDLPDLKQAFIRATTAARDVMAGEVREGRLCLSCCIVIEDDKAQEVGRLPFKEALTVSGI